MKRVVCLAVMLVLGFSTVPPAMAQEESATTQEVFDMVVKASYLIEQLGDEGLAAFNDPKGEFVWKDTYVFVTDCSKGVMAAHPNPNLVGLDTSAIKCKKTGRLILKEGCEQASTDKAKAKGAWVEYWWDKPGADTPQRKITFIISVPNTRYQVGAGIYDDTVTLDELNKLIQ